MIQVETLVSVANRNGHVFYMTGSSPFTAHSTIVYSSHPQATRKPVHVNTYKCLTRMMEELTHYLQTIWPYVKGP